MSQAGNQTGNRIFGFLRIDVAVGVLSLALSPAAVCQTAPIDEVDQPPSETVEEIIVYGDKSMSILRFEMNHAADITFDLFNSLNSDDEFDIHCYQEARIGSRIKRRVCRPNFEKEIVAESYRSLLMHGIPIAGAEARINQKTELLQAKMEALVSEHPKLQKALSEFIDAQQAVDDEHERRCGGGTFVCRKLEE